MLNKIYRQKHICLSTKELESFRENKFSYFCPRLTIVKQWLPEVAGLYWDESRTPSSRAWLQACQPLGPPAPGPSQHCVTELS